MIAIAAAAIIMSPSPTDTINMHRLYLCVPLSLFLSSQNCVQSYFEELIKRVPKLFGVIVTDKDGVALVRGNNNNNTHAHKQANRSE